MAETTATARKHLPEATELIRAELKRIRGPREGLSAETVSAHGRQLQRLPAVTDHIVRRDLPPGSRPDATVSVVRCAVNHLVKEPWRTFLKHTLVNTGHRPVGERVHDAGEEVGIASDTQREGADNKSYRNLARAVVGAEVSPCVAEAMTAVAENLAEIAGRNQAIANILSDWGMDEVADLLNAQLPRGVRALTDTRDAQARASRLIQAALEAHGARLSTSEHYVPAPLLMYRLTGELPAAAGAQFDDTDDEEVMELQVVEEMELLAQVEESRPGFAERLAHSTLFAADALAYEERHQWPSLRGPSFSDLPRRP